MQIFRHVGILSRCSVKYWYQSLTVRSASSFNKLVAGQFDAQTRSDIEEHWKPLVEKQNKTHAANGEKYYVLSMFPYPSGKLHMGHVRVYTISDAMARYQRMHGKQVIHPMGWDAFGLPAENAAIENGIPPDKWTKSNIENMRAQLKYMCYSFDWDREFATCDPEYYKWTQHIFLRMFQKGLVYRRASSVNWDPVDCTVLAEEQIDDDGRSWRSGAKVESKYLEQWYIKTTAFAESLLDGLEEVKPDLWRDIIKLQRHWIGQCTGTKLDFRIMTGDHEPVDQVLTVFTEEPELLHGVTHVTLHSENQLNQQKYSQAGSNTLDIVAVNPVTGKSLPLIVCDKTSYPLHTNAKLGIPCMNDDAHDVAASHQLQVVPVLDHDSLLINSGPWNNLTQTQARSLALKHAKDHGYGGHVTSARLNDWLISRQRYWGTPIPIIHCHNCGVVPVPYEDLPVKLPEVTSLSGKGESPLAADTSWNQVTCPSCHGNARRETDTMDTFVDSSWYYLRYLDPHNEQQPFSTSAMSENLPVDLYIGGKEHATLHLYFARYFMHFLHAEGQVPCREPFYNLLTQGMVLGQSYRVKGTGKYLRPEQVDSGASPPRELETGLPVVSLWEKMSKSKHNGVDPASVLEEYGVDSTRLCILGGVAPKSDRKWQPEFFKGIQNWQSRIWVLVSDYINARQNGDRKQDGDQKQDGGPERTIDYETYEQSLFNKRNYCLNEYMFHMERTFMISTGISRLQMFTSELKKIPVEVMAVSSEFSRSVSLLVMMVAPLAPMFASELWSGLQTLEDKVSTDRDWAHGVLEQQWPTIDQEYLFPIYVRSGHDELFTAYVPYRHVSALTPESALEVVRTHPDYEQYQDQILSLRAQIEPGLRVDVSANLQKGKKKKRGKSSR